MKPQFRILIYILMFETISVPLRADIKDTLSSVGKTIESVGNKVLPYAQNYFGTNTATQQSQTPSTPLEALGCYFGPLETLVVPNCAEGSNAISMDPNKAKQIEYAGGLIQNAQNAINACIRNKEDTMRTLFDESIKNIDLAWTKIEEEHAQFSSEELIPFRAALEKDYNYLYTGKGVDFSKLFSGNTCRSIASAKMFDQQGSVGKGGLRSILKENEEIREKQEQFSKDPSLPTRLNNFISDVANRAEDGGLSEFGSLDLKMDGSDEFSTSPTYQKTVKDLQTQYNTRFKAYEKSLTKYLGGTDHEGIIAKLSRANLDTIDIDKEITAWTNETQTKCLYSSIQGGEESFGKIFGDVYDTDRNITYDNTKYKTGDSSPSSEISRNISSILENNQTDIKSKLRSIKSYIYDPRYRRDETYVKLGSKYGNKGAYHKWNPYQLILQFYKTCQSGNTNESRINNQKVGTVISNVKAIAAKMKKDKENFTKVLKVSLQKTLINCQSSNTAMKGEFCSPTSDPFSLSGNFCLKKANICSENIESCLGKAQVDYDNRRQSLGENAKVYNTTVSDYVKKRRADLLKMKADLDVTFETIESFGITRDASGDFNLHQIDDLLNGKKTDDDFAELDQDLDIKLLTMNGDELLAAFKSQKEVLKNQLLKSKDKFEERLDKEMENVGLLIKSKEEGMAQCNAAIQSAAGLVKEHNGSCQLVQSGKAASTDKVEQIIAAYEALPSTSTSQVSDKYSKDRELYPKIQSKIEDPTNEIPVPQDVCQNDIGCIDSLKKLQTKICTKNDKNDAEVTACNDAIKKAQGHLRIVQEKVGTSIVTQIAKYSEDIDICNQKSAQSSLGRGDGKTSNDNVWDKILEGAGRAIGSAKGL